MNFLEDIHSEHSNTRSKLDVVWLPLGLLVSASAAAQAPGVGQPPIAPREAQGSAPFYDPAQLPSFNGKVQQFTLSPRGEIDGLILSDGTEVKTPRHLSPATRQGRRRARRRAVESCREGRHAKKNSDADDANLTRVEIEDTVERTLHGPKGEVRGVLLSSGRRIERFSPHAADGARTLLTLCHGFSYSFRTAEIVIRQALDFMALPTGFEPVY